MKNKILMIITILLLIIIAGPSFLSFDSSIVKKENKLMGNYKDTYNLIKTKGSIGINKVVDGKILIDEDVEKIIDQNTNGMFNKTSSGEIYGYLQIKNICIQQKYLDKEPKIYNKECDELETEKTSSDLIQEKIENLIADNELTGLNNTLPFSSKYYYKGVNPNNYIMFSGSCWRIVNIAQNNSIKIIYEGKSVNNSCEKVSSSISGSLGLYTWDIYKNKKGNWENQSSLRKIMYYWETDKVIDNESLKINLDFKKLENADWYIGQISSKNLVITDDIDDERTTLNVEPMKLGLINASDYLKISCMKSASASTDDCKNNNYLYKENYNWWTLNNSNSDSKNVWVVMQDGKTEDKGIKLSNEYFFSGLRLTAFLKSNVKFIGKGTSTNPYKII